MSIPTTQRQIHLASRPSGIPTVDNFEVAEAPVPTPGDGEFLVRNDWISVDPYMRGRMRDTDSYVPPFPLGKPMEGGCVGEVVTSHHPDFSVGDFVVGNLGWREYWTSDGEGVQPVCAYIADPRH